MPGSSRADLPFRRSCSPDRLMSRLAEQPPGLQGEDRGEGPGRRAVPNQYRTHPHFRKASAEPGRGPATSSTRSSPVGHMHRAGSRPASEPAAAPTSRLLRRRLRRVRFSAILCGSAALALRAVSDAGSKSCGPAARHSARKALSDGRSNRRFPSILWLFTRPSLASRYIDRLDRGGSLRNLPASSMSRSGRSSSSKTEGSDTDTWNAPSGPKTGKALIPMSQMGER